MILGQGHECKQCGKCTGPALQSMRDKEVFFRAGVEKAHGQILLVASDLSVFRMTRKRQWPMTVRFQMAHHKSPRYAKRHQVTVGGVTHDYYKEVSPEELGLKSP